jgi:uncharacterized protein (TIGR03032 family)
VGLAATPVPLVHRADLAARECARRRSARHATADHYERLYVPRASHTTGDIDAHEIGVDANDNLIFVNTKYSCLATTDPVHSFRPIWKPSFISKLAPEDRCHLNGLAMRDGRPAYVTCVAATNLAEAWREHRRDGGLVLDVATGETVAAGLSMPHSPRLHRGRLWLVQSGTGEFGHLDLATGRFEPVCFLQGYARGLAFVGNHAVVGVSRPRENRTFDGLALDERLAREGVGPLCHLAVVNLATGDIEHRLVIEGVVEELYDVAALPGVIRPLAIGFRSDEIRFLVRPAQD